MKDMIQKAMEWVKKTFRDPYSSEIQQYLNEAIDAADLERRIRLVERRGLL